MKNITAPTTRLCTSCQMCAAVCPRHAITINLDTDGFYRPAVNTAQRTDCGLCQQVCHKYHAPLPTPSATLEAMPAYAAWANDSGVVRRTTSGGIADVLARHLAETGYTCVGAAYDAQHDIARHRLATTAADTAAFQGSKYIQSRTAEAFREIVEADRERRFAVFCLPCQAFAIDTWLRARERRNQVLLVDLFCHGCPSMHVWRKYIAAVRHRHTLATGDTATFRSKAKGWGTFHIGIGHYVSPAAGDNFFELFFSDSVLCEACHACTARSTFAHCDLRLGDFWGRAYAGNVQGVSLIVAATAAGQTAFDGIAPQLTMRRHQHHDWLPYQSYGHTYRPDTDVRRRMLQCLADPQAPLSAAIDIYRHSLPLPARIKQHLRNAVLRLPARWVATAKQFYYRLR